MSPSTAIRNNHQKMYSKLFLLKLQVNSVRQRTRVMPSAENAIFDDTFVYEVPNVTPQTLGSLNVEMEAIDTHTVRDDYDGVP